MNGEDAREAVALLNEFFGVGVARAIELNGKPAPVPVYVFGAAA